MECPRPIKSVLCRFYPTWSSRTRPSMRIRSEGRPGVEAAQGGGGVGHASSEIFVKSALLH